ncbi:hypothetical protein AXX17_AT4G20630 [Arabidopsis thaliana]|uniref:Uncharacterized protein n=1 Tax=Arabidopsis thaliana TaxID=3702 RepID=A0A178V317_ARATH|nr:hypothetical protein AXX17_AT4G20630 [Arabidopsis thaliana]
MRKITTSGGQTQHGGWCSLESGQTRKLVPQIVKPCSSYFPVTHHFYLFDVGRVSVKSND